MTMKRKRECNSPDCVSYTQLDLTKRVVPTRTEVHTCISHFRQGEFPVIPMQILSNVSGKQYFQFQHSMKTEPELNSHKI